MGTKLKFEECDFHDCYIHGIAFIDEELHIDIDYIVEWPDCSNDIEGSHYFKIRKAMLKFEDSWGSEIKLDGYHRSIDWVEKIEDSETEYAKWIIRTHDGSHLVEIKASGMVLEVLGKIHTVKNRQYLTSEERAN